MSQPQEKEHQLIKQCRVKSSGLVRYQKEYNSYIKECMNDESKVQLMIQENKCKHDINKMKQVLKETEVMIPIVKDKLVESTQDMEEFMEENGEEIKKISEETYTKAMEQISLTKAFIESIQDDAEHKPKTTEETTTEA